MLTIGEFSQRSHLSPKALRLYDELGLLRPASVDPSSGYRLYSEDQVEVARLVALCRRLEMPLAVIGPILQLGPKDAAQAIQQWWHGVEHHMGELRSIALFLQARLNGEVQSVHEIMIREIPERRVLSISRHLTIDEIDAFFTDAFSRLRAAASGLDGVAGLPYLVFYGEVSADSDGPVELCRPVSSDTGSDAVHDHADVQLRQEPAHEEAYIRLPQGQTTWEAMLPAVEQLERWTRENRRDLAGPLRQVLIGDQRTASTGTPVIDLTVPLR